VDTRRERLLFQMIINIASSIGEIQQSILGLADNFPENHQRELLEHSNAITAQINEFMAKAKEYQAS
jgi:hypothetical protein